MLTLPRCVPVVALMRVLPQLRAASIGHQPSSVIEARTQAYALWVHKALRRDLSAVVQAYALDIKNYERQTDAADAARAAAAVWATAPDTFPAVDLPDVPAEPDPNADPQVDVPDPEPTPPVDK